MKLDISTLVFITSIIFTTQTIAVFVQYKVNKTYNGLGQWLMGAVLQAMGFLLMLTLNIRSIWMLSIFANPLVYSGQIILYIGIVKFLDKKERRWFSISLFAVYIIPYFYFIFINNSIFGRSIVVSSSAAVIALIIAYTLFSDDKKKHFSSSANFTASVFFAYGCLQTVITFFTLFLPHLNSYQDFHHDPVRIMAFIVPIVGSMLWTFGFIIMVNQRLNAENLEEKEKLQLVFNMSPDAKLITRMNDGLLADVNAGFLLMTGFTRDETIGNTILDINVWDSTGDRQSFLAGLIAEGFVENREFVFLRKDGSRFIGMLSGRIIVINDQDHVVSVIHDITERKQGEQKIQELVQQLEIEKNAAQLNAVTDSLTGLLNRRYFDESLRTEFYRLRRSGAPLSLIILDIDHFKKFNDTYGHLAGDNCLRQVGDVLKTASARLHDIVARYGGEEFVVIMPETEKQGAATLAERIRKGVEEMAIAHSTSGTSEYVTVSLGVVTVYTTELTEPEQIIAFADEALYEAKHGGRNRIKISANSTTIGKKSVI
ncbi:MAG TPA: diguanylate cyclase [Spirochaetota bacterium]|nr:diguanylate cyclase [Spirochaetota bacterium]